MLLSPLPKGKKNSEVNSMKTKISNFTEFRAYYLSEFELYDGEAFITFNIVGIDLDFEYGVMFERVHLDDFEEAA